MADTDELITKGSELFQILLSEQLQEGQQLPVELLVQPDVRLRQDVQQQDVPLHADQQPQDDQQQDQQQQDQMLLDQLLNQQLLHQWSLLMEVIIMWLSQALMEDLKLKELSTLMK